MANLVGACPKHPKYTGKSQPRTSCKTCWSFWQTINPVARVSANLIRAMSGIPSVEQTEPPVLVSAVGDEEEFVLLLSDLQVGVCSPTFSFSVFHRRMDTLAKSIGSIVSLHRKAHPVKKLNIFMLGDFIQNEMIGRVVDLDHLEGTVAIQLFQHCIPALQIFLRTMLQVFEEVEVWCVRGNHGSLGKFMADSTNFDDVAYYFLKQVFVREHRIQFHIAGQFFNMASVMGHKFMLVHGDKIPMHLTLPWYGVTTRAMRWQGSIGEFEYLCLGHFHVFSVVDWSNMTVFSNGTFLSDDEWTIKTLGLSSSVCQMLLGVHPKRGVSFVRRVGLEK